MVDKDTPFLNVQILKWLIAYFISNGHRKRGDIYMRFIDHAEVRIHPIWLINILNEMEKDCLVVGNESYKLTSRGEQLMRSTWEIAMSAISKKLYQEITKHAHSGK